MNNNLQMANRLKEAGLVELAERLDNFCQETPDIIVYVARLNKFPDISRPEGAAIISLPGRIKSLPDIVEGIAYRKLTAEELPGRPEQYYIVSLEGADLRPVRPEGSEGAEVKAEGSEGAEVKAEGSEGSEGAEVKAEGSEGAEVKAKGSEVKEKPARPAKGSVKPKGRTK